MRWLWVGLACAFACGDDDGAALDAALEDAAVGLDAADGDAGPPAPTPELGRHTVELIDTRRVVPSDGLPSDVAPMHSNNNLDVIRHEGRVYLAFRTAPDHFASAETLMHVVSSSDEVSWDHEATFGFSTDIREPRFLVLDGRLRFYFSLLGTDAFTFDPMGVRVTEREGDGTWSEPVDIDLTGYVVWRTKVERGTAYMSTYLGGEHIYLFDGEPLDVELRTSTDGISWTPLAPAGSEEQHVYRGGGSEMDFTLTDEGDLLAVIRNEAGDETGFGSLVCRAPADDLGAWNCRHDPKKYDSPLMFWHDGEAYLIRRRNVTDTGHYDLEMMAPTMTALSVRYQAAYVATPKRCSLWRYVQDEDRIAYVMDLPSRGDTCFASKIEGVSGEELVIYNYSSDIDGEDVPWRVGQDGNTYIYRHVLRFEER